MTQFLILRLSAAGCAGQVLKKTAVGVVFFGGAAFGTEELTCPDRSQGLRRPQRETHATPSDPEPPRDVRRPGAARVQPSYLIGLPPDGRHASLVFSLRSSRGDTFPLAISISIWVWGRSETRRKW